MKGRLGRPFLFRMNPRLRGRSFLTAMSHSVTVVCRTKHFGDQEWSPSHGANSDLHPPQLPHHLLKYPWRGDDDVVHEEIVGVVGGLLL